MLRKSILSVAIMLPIAAQAGGLAVYEMGTSDVGYAGAGTAARAEDASTVYANPAGMTRLQGNQLTVAGQAMYGKFDYKLNGQGALSGSNPDNAVGWVPGGSTFYSHSINDRLKMGVAVYNSFGASLDFGNDWAGRNVTTGMTLATMTVQPTVAYRLNDKWSLGAGLAANYGVLENKRVAVAGGKLKEKDSDWEYGARLGVMFEPTTTTRVGVVWSSKVEYDYDFTARVTGLAGRTHTLPIKAITSTPQQVMLSTFQKLSERWALTGNIGWQDWSEFSNFKIETGGGSSDITLPLQDTWHFALGAQYRYNEKTKLSFGVAHDSSFYKNQRQTTFTLPSGAQWRFGTGVQYTLSPKSDLGLALEYVTQESSYDQSRLLSGKYDEPSLFFMAVNYNYRF